MTTTTTTTTTPVTTTNSECTDQRSACRIVRWYRQRFGDGNGRRNGRRRGRGRSLTEDFQVQFADLSPKDTELERQRRRRCDLRFWWSRYCRWYYSCRRRQRVRELCPDACGLC